MVGHGKDRSRWVFNLPIFIYEIVVQGCQPFGRYDGFLNHKRLIVYLLVFSIFFLFNQILLNIIRLLLIVPSQLFLLLHLIFIVGFGIDN